MGFFSNLFGGPKPEPALARVSATTPIPEKAAANIATLDELGMSLSFEFIMAANAGPFTQVEGLAAKIRNELAAGSLDEGDETTRRLALGVTFGNLVLQRNENAAWADVTLADGEQATGVGFGDTYVLPFVAANAYLDEGATKIFRTTLAAYERG